MTGRNILVNTSEIGASRDCASTCSNLPGRQVKSFGKHSAQTFFTRGCLAVIGLFAGIINARWLGVEGVGVLALLLLAKSFAFRFGNLGFGSAIAYFVAKGRVELHHIYIATCLLAAGLSCITGASLFLLWRQDFSPWKDISIQMFFLSLPAITILFFYTYLQRLLSGKLKIMEMNVAQLIVSSSNMALLVILVILLKSGVPGAFLAEAIAEFFGCVYLIIKVRSLDLSQAVVTERRPVSWALVRELWQYGRWNYLAMLTSFLNEELPTILLKNFTVGASAVGLFTRARGLGRQTRLVVLPLSEVLFPYTASSSEKDAGKLTAVLCRNFLVVMIVGVGVLTLFAKQIIVGLYGEAFISATQIFYALAPAFVIWPILQFMGVHIAATGKPKWLFFSDLLVLCVAGVTCCFVIPKYGAVGAGVSLSVIYTVNFVVRTFIYVRATRTALAELIIPRRSDLARFRNMYTTVLTGLKEFRFLVAR